MGRLEKVSEMGGDNDESELRRVAASVVCGVYQFEKKFNIEQTTNYCKF